MAPTENDIKTGLSFALAYHNEDLAEFLDLTWVDGWLRDVFTQQAAEQEERTARHISASLREFEYQAHYLNVLALLGSQLRIPEIKITTNTLQEPAVNVDLILDVGNSHTCGILVEDHADESYGLNQTYELQLRDLSKPHYLYNALFESRVEFAQAKFGQQSFQLKVAVKMLLSGLRLPVLATKPAVWHYSAWAPKVRPVFPAHDVFVG